MYPHERSLVEKYPADKFAIVGVNSDKTVETAREVVKKNELSWKNFYDGSPSGAIATRWNVSGWPTIYVIDAAGIIRYKDVRGDELDAAIETLVSGLNDAGRAEKTR